MTAGNPICAAWHAQLLAALPVEEQEITFEPNENTKDVSDTIIPVINPNKRDEDENVTSKIEDIKAYLQDQGFVIDYSLLDEEEKNRYVIDVFIDANP